MADSRKTPAKITFFPCFYKFGLMTNGNPTSCDPDDTGGARLESTTPMAEPPKRPIRDRYLMELIVSVTSAVFTEDSAKGLH